MQKYKKKLDKIHKIKYYFGREDNREGDDTMAAISRSVSRALVLNSHKASEFLNKKVNTSADAIKRFENRKKGKGA